MNLKKHFLPVGLMIAVAISLLFAGPGAFLKQSGLVPWLIVAIFLINGWQFRLREARLDARFARAFGAGALLTLVGGPILGLGTAKLFGLHSPLLLGLVVMAAMPTTLSSATVITFANGGNAAWALFMTVGFNLVGIFSIPFMLQRCLGHIDGLQISSGALLTKLMALVLLPFLAGLAARRLAPKPVDTHPLVAFIPSTCVILTVWASLSASREMLRALPPQLLPIIGLATLAVHLLLLMAASGLGRTLKLKSAERMALAFTASQKTMPVALSVLTALGADSGPAVLVCLIFHFLQLLGDSFIASHLACPSTAPQQAAQAEC